MAPGVGKTYAMLEMARREMAAGHSVIIGYLESHGRVETDALAEGIPVIPRRAMEHRGVVLEEMDLDAVLQAKPHWVVVDELAHTNAPGSRHPKRYQDVIELLDAGIHVTTTLNVQHVSSRSEVVREIVGIRVQEMVPDSILEDAEIELVDLSPVELLERFRQGRVYVAERAREAARGFFQPANLTALREMALRLAAEHVGVDTQHFRATMTTERVWKTGQRLMMALGPSPLSESLARWTRRFADNLQASWIAVHVDMGKPLGPAESARLKANLDLARELGAEILLTTDGDVVAGLLRVARQRNVTQIVVGKPNREGWFRGVGAGRVLDRLVRESGNIDVLCVRAESMNEGRGLASRWSWAPGLSSEARQYGLAIAVMGGVTLLNWTMREWSGRYAPSLVYLLSIVLLALVVGRGPTLLAGTAGALLWNFLFLPPVYTFWISSFQDGLLFLLFFVLSVVLGQLTAKLRVQQELERRREHEATALYLLTRELAEGVDLSQLLSIAVRHIGDTFRAEVSLGLRDASDERGWVAYPFGTHEVPEHEWGVVTWVLRNARPAGRSTETLGAAGAYYAPLLAPNGCLGVVGLRWRGRELLEPGLHSLLESFLRQIAVVLDRQRLRDAAEEMRRVSESERLGKTLLNSVSHELRTPLAAIATASAALRHATIREPVASQLVDEIEQASRRLDRLVRNLLDVARLESGHVRPRCDWCDPVDLARTAVMSSGARTTGRAVSIECDPELPLVWTDFVLMEQVLVNLLTNAMTHTPEGSPVDVVVFAEEQWIGWCVNDRGSGVPEAERERIFGKFQRLPRATPGGTGLGLSIVRGFLDAMGGTVDVEARPGGGSIFRVRLPRTESPRLPAEAL